MNHISYRNITSTVVVLGLALAASSLQAKPETGTSKDRLDELEADLADLQVQVDDDGADIGNLQTALAAQLQLNIKQQNRINSLIKFIRGSDTQQEARRINRSIRQRLRKIQEMNEWYDAGLMPAQLPATILYHEMNLYNDLAEKFRCSIIGIEKLGSDDCILSTDVVVQESVIAVSTPVQEVYEEFTVEIGVIADDTDALIAAAIEAGSPECTLWEADPENDVKLGLCLASVGVDTAETFIAVTAAMIQSAQTTEVLVGELALEPCIEIIGSGNAECPSYEDFGEATGAWESITIEGEAAPEPDCSLVTGWNSVTSSVGTACL